MATSALPDINSFLQNGLIYDGARPNRFQVIASLPAIAIGDAIDAGAIKKLAFTCKSASIPAFRAGVVPVPYMGRQIKVSGDRVWDDWDITVMLDEDYVTRSMFEAWNNSLNHLEGNIMQPNMDGGGYKSTWVINHLGKDNTVIRSYELVGAWPAIIGPIRLDWEGNNRISTFDVSVAFDYLDPVVEGQKGDGTTYRASAFAVA